MAQSPEYPDLKWIEPYAWGEGRDGKAVRYIVVHYTAGSERSTSAEDGAQYNQDRRDGTSAHYFVDSDSVVQGVRTRDRANCARHKGNRLGIQYEFCGTVQTRAQWLDPASLATLKNGARQIARDCKKYNIPVRRLSVAETRRAWTEFPNGPKGIVGHVDCTYAYPEDGGDHTDPGTQFPWDVLLDLIRKEMEETMDLTPDNLSDIADAVVDKLFAAKVTLTRKPDNTPDEQWSFASAVGYAPEIGRQNRTIGNEVKALATAVKGVTEKVLLNVQADDADTAKILAQVDKKAADIVTHANTLAQNEAQILSEAATAADDRQAELLLALENVDEEVLVALGSSDTPDEQVAAALVQLLGPRKEAIVALMQQ